MCALFYKNSFKEHTKRRNTTDEAKYVRVSLSFSRPLVKLSVHSGCSVIANNGKRTEPPLIIAYFPYHRSIWLSHQLQIKYRNTAPLILLPVRTKYFAVLHHSYYCTSFEALLLATVTFEGVSILSDSFV